MILTFNIYRWASLQTERQLMLRRTSCHSACKFSRANEREIDNASWNLIFDLLPLSWVEGKWSDLLLFRFRWRRGHSINNWHQFRFLFHDGQSQHFHFFLRHNVSIERKTERFRWSEYASGQISNLCRECARKIRNRNMHVRRQWTFESTSSIYIVDL